MQTCHLHAGRNPPAWQAALTCREGDGAELHPVQVAPDAPVLHHGVAHGLVVLDVSCKGTAGVQTLYFWLFCLPGAGSHSPRAISAGRIGAARFPRDAAGGARTGEELEVGQGLGQDTTALLLHGQRDDQEAVGQLREVLDEVVLPAETKTQLQSTDAG